ncbi:hypothetical protein ANN_10886 [Periplaneta americana]|uniref:DUF4371 domain-containing protein n=1 Tax=Periplaneta americana TaxID=6978 RepID=A0ABQ8T589_PERAM|nr:hypothetical protein ANN_10886 [Periplaneta americana]
MFIMGIGFYKPNQAYSNIPKSGTKDNHWSTMVQLAFQGHDETENSVNRGNYVELLKYTAEYDPLLAEHLETSTMFKGISNRIQNDLIQAVGSTVLSAIKQEIIEVPFVAVMVDETSDVANKAQFSIVLLYVHEGEIKERFLGFCDISSDKHAQAIAELIRHFLSEFGCNEKLIAQTYDGAATMAGNLNGVQALIKVTHPEALFFHCYAHNQANDILYCQEKIQETRRSIAALRDDYEGVFQETVSQVVERSFSTLKRIKSYSRNSTGGKRLSHLGIISIEARLLGELRKKKEFFDEVVTKFASQERRIEFQFR